MRVWNADGGQVEPAQRPALRRLAADGIDRQGQRRHRHPRRPDDGVAAEDGRVTVDMGRRVSAGNRSRWTRPWTRAARASGRPHRRSGPAHAGRGLHGQSHVVLFMDHAPNDGFVRGTGSLIEHHPRFPEGVNVGFAHVVAPDHIRAGVGARRGPDEGLRHRPAPPSSPSARRGLSGRAATVEVDGGDLFVSWDEATDHVLMTGPWWGAHGMWPSDAPLPLGEGLSLRSAAIGKAKGEGRLWRAASPLHTPDPHPALRATSPKGEGSGDDATRESIVALGKNPAPSTPCFSKLNLQHHPGSLIIRLIRRGGGRLAPGPSTCGGVRSSGKRRPVIVARTLARLIPVHVE